MKVFAITRPKPSIEKSKKILKENGYKPKATPTIQLYPEHNQEYKKLIQNILEGETDILILTSQNGVKYFFNGIENQKKFKQKLKEITVYAIGPKTQKALKKHNVDSLIPEIYSSTGLVKQIGNQVDGKHIEIARSNHGSPKLSEGLKKYGATVHDVPIYKVGMPRNKKPIKKLINEINQKQIDIIGFTSQMTVKNYMKVAKELETQNKTVRQMNNMYVAAIGHPTKDILNEYGVKEVIVPKDYLFTEMVKEVNKTIEARK
ncbi:Uroporphyrinogen-III synthase HemD [Methanonatronarchaeum thermophilum]|uniref:Uroporphyrinogen-III synthase HemD n=1 Tax=Methanonatronarchaeum thermophilum TaxID=1927129 RepID=A0A1Y3GGK2_9EURY|nr:uroporphyrinogen-III synthase [Methanonatronarchaeum thermophilum]OUJ19453.1 Uroporphyrinogen-III synthase HemD [Methanonatronarchaeum thermophilum]